MYFTSTTAVAALTLAACVAALPTQPKLNPVNIRITGAPDFNQRNTTYYLGYGLGLFGETQSQFRPTTNRSDALLFDVMPDRTLKSSTGMTIAVGQLSDAPWNPDGPIYYVNYTGLEGTYVSNHHHREILNINGNFSSWEVCNSQYGPGFGFVSSAWNQTAENEIQYPFLCYEVKFHALENCA